MAKIKSKPLNSEEASAPILPKKVLEEVDGEEEGILVPENRDGKLVADSPSEPRPAVDE